MLDGATGSPLAELWLTTEIAAPAGSLRAPSAETGEGADRENQRKNKRKRHAEYLSKTVKLSLIDFVISPQYGLFSILWIILAD